MLILLRARVSTKTKTKLKTYSVLVCTQKLLEASIERSVVCHNNYNLHNYVRY